MTNQEAIDLLDNLIGMIEDNHGSDYDSAIRMAIDALTEPEIIMCKDCVHNDGSNPISDDRYWCMIHNSYMYYCSDGEFGGDSDEN